MVSFFHNHDSVSRFGEVLRTHTTTAATSYDYHIRLEYLWLIAWGNCMKS